MKKSTLAIALFTTLTSGTAFAGYDFDKPGNGTKEDDAAIVESGKLIGANSGNPLLEKYFKAETPEARSEAAVEYASAVIQNGGNPIGGADEFASKSDEHGTQSAHDQLMTDGLTAIRNSDEFKNATDVDAVKLGFQSKSDMRIAVDDATADHNENRWGVENAKDANGRIINGENGNIDEGFGQNPIQPKPPVKPVPPTPSLESKVDANEKRSIDNEKRIEDTRNGIGHNAKRLDDTNKEIVKTKERVDANARQAGENEAKNRSQDRDIKANRDAIKDTNRRIDNISESGGVNAGQLKTNREDIARNKARTDENTAKIDTNKQGISENKGRIDTNVKNINENRQGISENKGRIDTNISNINQNRNRISQNEQNIEALGFEVQDIRQELNALDQRVDEVEGKMSNGISMVGAMSQMQFNGGTGVGVGMSGYNGSGAIAIGAGHSFGENNQWNTRLSVGYAKSNNSKGSSDTMVAAGLTYSW